MSTFEQPTLATHLRAITKGVLAEQHLVLQKKRAELAAESQAHVQEKFATFIMSYYPILKSIAEDRQGKTGFVQCRDRVSLDLATRRGAR